MWKKQRKIYEQERLPFVTISIGTEMNKFTYREHEYPVNMLMDAYGADCYPTNYTNEGLETALEGMPEKYRSAVLRRYKEKQSLGEIADAIGKTSSWAKTLILKGLRYLRHPLRLRQLTGETVTYGPGETIPIGELDLNNRCMFRLQMKGITSVNELLITPKDELLSIRNMGKKTYEEIMDRVKALGYGAGQPQ